MGWGQTDGHCDSMIESAQWADSMKIVLVVKKTVCWYKFWISPSKMQPHLMRACYTVPKSGIIILHTHIVRKKGSFSFDRFPNTLRNTTAAAAWLQAQ